MIKILALIAVLAAAGLEHCAEAVKRANIPVITDFNANNVVLFSCSDYLPHLFYLILF
jgi:hypothetical protein